MCFWAVCVSGLCVFLSCVIFCAWCVCEFVCVIDSARVSMLSVFPGCGLAVSYSACVSGMFCFL